MASTDYCCEPDLSSKRLEALAFSKGPILGRHAIVKDSSAKFRSMKRPPFVLRPSRVLPIGAHPYKTQTEWKPSNSVKLLGPGTMNEPSFNPVSEPSFTTE